MKSEAHQFVTALTYGDAIGDYTLQIQRILRKHGYASEIYSEIVDPRMTKYIRPLHDYELHGRDDTLMLVHFSIGSELGEIIPYYKGKKMLIYHNITPHFWFIDIDNRVAAQCLIGRRQLRILKEFCPIGLGVSEYNRLELETTGFQRTGILPIQLHFEKFNGQPDPITKAEYEDDRTNIIVVGRTSPNKKLEDCLKTFACYQKYVNPLSRLIIVGWRDGYQQYYLALRRLVTELQIKEVVFTGHISFEELIAYYSIADAFLTMSEHEGFCVPILEAFYMNVPVLAWDACAVSLTAGSGGMLVQKKKDYMAIAEMLNKICAQTELRRKILEAQRLQIKRQQEFPFEETLLKNLDALKETEAVSIGTV